MASIIFTIPDATLPEFREAFIKKNRVPVGPDDEPTMTENEWIKEWGKRQYMHAYKAGKEQLAREQAVIDEGIIA